MSRNVSYAGLLIMLITSSAGVPAAPQVPDEIPLGDGGAPTHVLIDNDKLRVNLISFPLGHLRPGGTVRRSDQILVYLDDGNFELASKRDRPLSSHGINGLPVVCGEVTRNCGPVDTNGNHTPADGSHPRGSVSWRPKGNSVGAIRITQAYRALYIELKHGASTAPDPAAEKLSPEKRLAGGAPARVVLDNEKVRVTVVTFPAGFAAQGGLKRRSDQLVVYLDDADLDEAAPDVPSQGPSAGEGCDPIKSCGPIDLTGKVISGSSYRRGTITWHPKDTVVESVRARNLHRVIYLELKQ